MQLPDGRNATFYSQCEEDRILYLELISAKPNVGTGTYVEIGGLDGKL